jgi:predicted ArsR family transcriptional regulator
VSEDDLASRITGLSALADPVRRALYWYVAGQGGAVSRDQAAADTGLARHTVKFHLDKLVDEGLLAVEYRRLSGRRGPGAGRPAKLYRRSDRQLSVSLPERRYDLAGSVLATAVERAACTGEPVREVVDDVAAAEGRRMAAAAPPVAGDPAADGLADEPADPLDDAAAVLARAGYEPRVEAGRVVLVNCPFAALAREHTELVCGMNLALLGALARERGGGLCAALDPAPGRCCVTLARTAG